VREERRAFSSLRLAELARFRRLRGPLLPFFFGCCSAAALGDLLLVPGPSGVAAGLLVLLAGDGAGGKPASGARENGDSTGPVGTATGKEGLNEGRKDRDAAAAAELVVALAGWWWTTSMVGMGLSHILQRSSVSGLRKVHTPQAQEGSSAFPPPP